MLISFRFSSLFCSFSFYCRAFDSKIVQNKRNCYSCSRVYLSLYVWVGVCNKIYLSVWVKDWAFLNVCMYVLYSSAMSVELMIRIWNIYLQKNKMKRVYHQKYKQTLRNVLFFVCFLFVCWCVCMWYGWRCLYCVWLELNERKKGFNAVAVVFIYLFVLVIWYDWQKRKRNNNECSFVGFFVNIFVDFLLLSVNIKQFAAWTR